MTWDDNAPTYPGYRLGLVVGDNPPYGETIYASVKVTAPAETHDSVIGDIVRGMAAQGYRLRSAEISNKYWVDDQGAEQWTALDTILSPMTPYFAGWE